MFTIPTELTALYEHYIWAVFEFDPVTHKKRPITVNGHVQSCTDTTTLFTYAKAVEYLNSHTGTVLAVSLPLASMQLGYTLMVVDLDCQKEEFNQTQLATYLASDTFIDVSPSRQGYHLWYSFDRKPMMPTKLAAVDHVAGFVTLSGIAHNNTSISYRVVPGITKDNTHNMPLELLIPNTEKLSPIRAFNEQCEYLEGGYGIRDMLERHGYLPKGRKMLYHDSTTGAPGVVFYPASKGSWEVLYSFHGDDIIGGHVRDPFDIFRLLECNGNLAHATREAALKCKPVDYEQGELLDPNLTLAEWNEQLDNTENLAESFIEHSRDNVTRQEYTTVPDPKGGLLHVVQFVESVMRYPNRQIAIAVAEHLVSVFGGGHWMIGNNTTTRKRILLANTGVGKNAINRAMNKVFTGLATGSDGAPVGNLVDIRQYQGSDAFSFYNGHKEMEQHRVRSFVLNEAGLAGKSKAGDIGTLRAYQLQVLSTKADESFTPKKYTESAHDNNPNNQAQDIYGGVWCYFHESTVASYAGVLSDSESFITGDMSRSDLFFISGKLHSKNKNNNGDFSGVVKTMFTNMVNDFRSSGNVQGTEVSNLNVWAEIDYSQIEEDLDNIENFIMAERNKADEEKNEFLISELARKNERLLGSILIQAIADASMYEEQMYMPVATKEHLQYAIDRQHAIDTTVNYHTKHGELADDMGGVIEEFKRKLCNGGKVHLLYKNKWDDNVGGYVITKSYITWALAQGSKAKRLKTNVYRGDNMALRRGVLDELVSQNIVTPLIDGKTWITNTSILSKTAVSKKTFLENVKTKNKTASK